MAMEPGVDKAAALEEGSPLAKRAKILLVDDHNENLLALEAVLKDLGHPLVLAHSGKEALKILLEEDFAMILLDVLMPEMDGFETAALIRQRQRSRNTPIIFLTAVSKGEMSVFKGYSVGAVDYILKPFVPEVLRAKVSVFVDLFIKTQQIREQAEELRRIESAEHRRELVLLRNQRNRFFQFSLEMMCILGFDGMLKEVNSPWESATGFSKRELRSRPFLDFVHPDDREATLAYLSRVQATPGALLCENRLRCKDGSYRWLSWSMTAFAKEHAYYAAARDINERKRAEGELRALNETLEARVLERTRELSQQAQELARSNAELERFASVASHDLREPLRKIAGFVQLFGSRYRGRLDPTADEYIRYIVSGVDRMQEIISDLLEYARVGTGERVLEGTDCRAIVEKALANLSSLVEEANATVAVRGSLPTILGEPSQLTSLFQNLIGNAVKFRAESAPLVEISCARDGDVWRFTVKDNGIGIPQEYQDRIFVLFKRLHSRKDYPGTGIGLAICKKIVEQHGGRIWVQSAPGEGSSFHFTLPASR